ncbi:MAG TPA: hypothetical protein VGX78_14615, partial [Pirellulales bacterium]|nr:hypothetical protein [Pirellulales bacterium]
HGKAAYHAGPLEILPAGDLAEPPFAGTYLVHLGDEIGQADFDQGIDRIVEYLYLDAATACGAVMDRWRNAGSAKGSGPRETGVPVRLRSFGLHARRFSKFLVAARQADQLCLRLVRRWLGEQEDRQNAPNAVQPPEFQLADLVARLTAIADKALGGSAETHFRALLAAGPGGPSVVRDDDPVGPFGDDLRRIHAVLGVPASAEVPPPAQPPPLECELREGAEKLAAALARSLVDSIRELVERPQARLPAATTAVSLAQGHLRDVRRAAEEAYRQDHDEATALWWKLQRGELPRGTAWFGRFSSAAKDPEDLLLDYCRLRLRAMIYKFVASMSQQAATEVASLGDRLGKLRQSVQSLADQFASGLASREQSTPAWLSSSERDLAEELAPLAERGSVEQFDETLQREWLEPRGGLLGLAEETSENLLILKRELRQRGCDRVMKVLDRVDAWYLLAKATSTAEKLSAAIQDGAEQAGIRLRGASGAEKLLVLMPQGAKGKLLVDALKHTWPDGFVVPSEEGDLVFCREVEGISLAEAANALVKGRDECAAAARHVLTRVDISWAALATE